LHNATKKDLTSTEQISRGANRSPQPLGFPSADWPHETKPGGSPAHAILIDPRLAAARYDRPREAPGGESSELAHLYRWRPLHPRRPTTGSAQAAVAASRSLHLPAPAPKPPQGLPV